MTRKKVKAQQRANRRELQDRLKRCQPLLSEILTQLLTPVPWAEATPERDRKAFATRVEDCSKAASIGWLQGVSSGPAKITVISDRAWRALTAFCHQRGYDAGKRHAATAKRLQETHPMAKPPLEILT